MPITVFQTPPVRTHQNATASSAIPDVKVNVALIPAPVYFT